MVASLRSIMDAVQHEDVIIVFYMIWSDNTDEPVGHEPPIAVK